MTTEAPQSCWCVTVTDNICYQINNLKEYIWLFMLDGWLKSCNKINQSYIKKNVLLKEIAFTLLNTILEEPISNVKFLL